MTKARPTAFCARVTDVAEARIAIDGGADRLGLSDARGALTLSQVVAIVEAAGRHISVSSAPAVLGNGDDAHAADQLAKAGVAALELDATSASASLFADLRKAHPAIVGIVALRNTTGKPPGLGFFAERGFAAASLRPPADSARLIEEPGIEGLSQFVDAAQRRGLSAWIGGALEPPDVPRLLALRPDVLVFRAGLCADGRRDATLDPARVAMMRALIPRETERHTTAVTATATASAHADAGAHAARRRSDKVFVRDFVVESGVGAYRYEHRAPQRMRFTVEADLAPIPDDVADMRDVFSYDVIVDAIRLATRRHVILVERIALDVAEATLRDLRVKRVRVRIEKLDILDGSIGVEIERGAGS